MSDPIIRIVGLKKSFGDLLVLDGIDLDIERGKTTAIIGPSGCGKSVLIKHVVGLIQPDEGHIYVDGEDIVGVSEKEKRAFRKRFGMTFQGGALFDSMSAGENVAFPLKYHTSMNEVERKQRAEEMLDLVELPGTWDRPTSALSGGMRKRVALARAIVMEPEVVVFDEPNSGLDPLTSDTIDALIERMQEKLGITFVVVTHDIVQAMQVSDVVAMLYGGKVVEKAPPDDFVRSPIPIVRDFLRRNVDLPQPETPTGG